MRNRERFDYDPLRQVLFVAMEFEPVGTAVGGLDDAPLPPPVLSAGMGWRCCITTASMSKSVEGDFTGGPLTKDSDVMVWHARLRSGAR